MPKDKACPGLCASASVVREAAAQGHALAQNNLAELYFAGLGVPQDYVRAYLWVSLAAVHMKGDEQKQGEGKFETMWPGA